MAYQFPLAAKVSMRDHRLSSLNRTHGLSPVPEVRSVLGSPWAVTQVLVHCAPFGRLSRTRFLLLKVLAEFSSSGLQT